MKNNVIHELKEVEVLIKEYDKLGGKLFNFIKYVEKEWKTTKNR